MCGGVVYRLFSPHPHLLFSFFIFYYNLFYYLISFLCIIFIIVCTLSPIYTSLTLRSLSLVIFYFAFPVGVKINTNVKSTCAH